VLAQSGGVGAGEAAAILGLAGLASFVGAVSGFGFALLIVPPLSALVGVKEAIVLANVLGASHSTAMFVRLRRAAHWPMVGVLAAAGFVGMPLGLFVLEVTSVRVLQVILGLTIAAATVLLLRGTDLFPRGRLGDAVVGFVSGVLNTSTSMNGPPVVLHLQSRGLDQAAFRGTLAAFFVITNILTIALYAVGGRLDGDVGARYLVGLPGLAAGWLLGNAAASRLPQRAFRSMVVGILFASAAVVLARAALG
jgi:uncharacterized protein